MNKDIRQLARALKDELGDHSLTKEICSQSSFEVFSCILAKIAEYEFADDPGREIQEHIEKYHEPTQVGRTKLVLRLSQLKNTVEEAEKSRDTQGVETLEYGFATEFTTEQESEIMGVKIQVNQ